MNDLLSSNLNEITGDLKIIIDTLRLAINDWPNPVISLDEYEIEVRTFLGDQVNKQTVEFILTDINLSEYAWQAESLSQLANIFPFYSDGSSLKDIIEDIKFKIG